MHNASPTRLFICYNTVLCFLVRVSLYWPRKVHKCRKQGKNDHWEGEDIVRRSINVGRRRRMAIERKRKRLLLEGDANFGSFRINVVSMAKQCKPK
ncbi:hypothetical protein K1719_005770 [Acacia pycnantha]|nr:hypothetical protein K1719_005770 [Acacia pycnantha]